VPRTGPSTVSILRMADLKRKGDLAELMVAADLLRQGYRVAFPYGEDWEADVLVLRAGALERVQVKHARSDGVVIQLKCFSQTVQAGRIRSVKRYTADMIDWLAVWDSSTGMCCYVPASELGQGRRTIHLRITPASSGRRKGVRMASDYRRLERGVEPAGLEPATS
jgi:hypothetical protein